MINNDAPPRNPFTAAQYNQYSLPWFDYYSDDSKPLKGSGKLKGLKSVVKIGKIKADKPLPENESAGPGKIVKLRKGLKKGQVREGRLSSVRFFSLSISQPNLILEFPTAALYKIRRS